MGLAVSAYRKLKEVTPNEDFDNYDFKVFVITDVWRDRVKNLKYESYYKADEYFDGITYSYSTHSRFRSQLAELIDAKENWTELTDKSIPFAYLFDFADNEGGFDWEISEKLYQDFNEYEQKAMLSDDKYFKLNYKRWMETVEFAKEKGYVDFR